MLESSKAAVAADRPAEGGSVPDGLPGRRTAAPPSHVGGHRVRAVLGRGPRGHVYLARHPDLGAWVVVKVIDRGAADRRGGADLVLSRARVASLLDHPNAVRVFDAGADADAVFVVQEFVDGGTLDEAVAAASSGRLSPEDAVRIAVRVADALAASVEVGLTHGGLRPSRILMTRDREPKLSDFGAGRDRPGGSGVSPYRSAPREAFTRTLPLYTAPERLVSSPSVDARADIYSLGVVLYQMVTGELPYVGMSEREMLLKLRSEPVPDPCELAPDLSVELGRIVRKMLAKTPDDRYQSAAEVVADLSDPALKARRSTWGRAVGALRGPVSGLAGLLGGQSRASGRL